MHQYLKFIFGITFYIFITVPLSIISSFHCTHSNGICQQTCIYYCVYSEKFLMMDTGTVRNMQSFYSKNKLEILVHLVAFIIRKLRQKVKMNFYYYNQPFQKEPLEPRYYQINRTKEKNLKPILQIKYSKFCSESLKVKAQLIDLMISGRLTLRCMCNDI